MKLEIDSFQENGITYYQLYIACPVDYSRGNAPCSFWMHGDDNCYGDIYVGDNAFYKCKKCGQAAPVLSCSYSCPSHSYSPDELIFFNGSGQLAATISLSGQMLAEAGLAWFQKFLVNLQRDKVCRGMLTLQNTEGGRHETQ